jgi:hypothetical protein
MAWEEGGGDSHDEDRLAVSLAKPASEVLPGVLWSSAIRLWFDDRLAGFSGDIPRFQRRSAAAQTVARVGVGQANTDTGIGIFFIHGLTCQECWAIQFCCRCVAVRVHAADIDTR